jgi:glycosidase
MELPMKNVNFAAIYHINWLEYRHALADGRICVRLRAGRGDFERVTLHVADMYGSGKPELRASECAMDVMWRDDMYDYYQAVIKRDDPCVSYFFSLERGGLLIYYDEDGVQSPAERAARDHLAAFSFNYAYPAALMPDWARGCVGYEIFPDRFRRLGLPEKGLEPWGSARVANNRRFGGNLKGMRDAIPHLKSLGVDMMYLTPIFISNTSHRANTFDYYRIDPLLGTESDLRDLARALHDNGMRIILDGVFNHCGVLFPPFMDARDRGPASRYYDWFFFDNSAPGYRHFGLDAQMPKLNLQNPDAQKYFLDVGLYWMESCGIDGWRLDVSPEVWPDFWRVFRWAVKSKNPDALLVAECWSDSRQWVTLGDMFDCTMNYSLSRAVWGLLSDKQTLSLREFDARVNRAMAMYPHANQEVMWNFLGSHDTERILTRTGNSYAKARAAAFFQMTCLGAPVIYYGDELAMEGGDDPECRRSMPWDCVEGNEMFAYYRRLIALRHEIAALRHGTLRTWHVDEAMGLYAYLREAEGQTALCVLCTGEASGEAMLPMPEAFASAEHVFDYLSKTPLEITAGCVQLTLSPGKGWVLIVPHLSPEPHKHH